MCGSKRSDGQAGWYIAIGSGIQHLGETLSATAPAPAAHRERFDDCSEAGIRISRIDIDETKPGLKQFSARKNGTPSGFFSTRQPSVSIRDSTPLFGINHTSTLAVIAELPFRHSLYSV
ncbi:MAG: hypothetical protein HY043_21305 [Verrucomicrobia bacterium]|nr:hypothetical protein [Verrucomicrobiota bacterium]